MGNDKTGNNMVRGCLLILMELKKKDYGKMEKELNGLIESKFLQSIHLFIYSYIYIYIYYIF